MSAFKCFCCGANIGKISKTSTTIPQRNTLYEWVLRYMFRSATQETVGQTNKQKLLLRLRIYTLKDKVDFCVGAEEEYQGLLRCQQTKRTNKLFQNAGMTRNVLNMENQAAFLQTVTTSPILLPPFLPTHWRAAVWGILTTPPLDYVRLYVCPPNLVQSTPPPPT